MSRTNEITEPNLIPPSGMPSSELLDKVSCFGCSHLDVCRVRYDFMQLTDVHKGTVNISMDINDLLAQNCRLYKPIN